MGTGSSKTTIQKKLDSKAKQEKGKTPPSSDCQVELINYKTIDDEGTVPDRNLTQQVTGNQLCHSDINMEDIKSTSVLNTSNDVLEENKESSANNTKRDEVAKQEINAEAKSPESSGLVTGNGKDNDSSTNGTANSFQVDSTSSDTKTASMTMGTDNDDNIKEDEVDKMEDKSAGKTVNCKDNQKNGSVIISKNESGEVQANDSANDNTDEPDRNNSFCNGKNTHSDNKLNASNENTTVSYSNTTNDDAEHQTVPENETKNEQTPVNERDKEQSNEANKKKFEGSKTTGREQAESEYRLNDNLLFYQNQIHSRPFPGEKIEEMLKWKGNYLKLERSHSYIQWLFPIPESRGMNYSAQALQEHEAKAISEDETLRERVLEAYKMMLDFYGMELVNDISGEVQRGENWKERYEHLDRSFHNRFRITRILKALGELGFEHFQEHWLEFIMHEATLHQQLPSLNGNCMDHWIGAVKDETKQGKFYCLLSDLNEQLLQGGKVEYEAKRGSDDSVGKSDGATSGDNTTEGIANQGVSHNNENSKTGHGKENNEGKSTVYNNVDKQNGHAEKENAKRDNDAIKSEVGDSNDDGKNGNSNTAAESKPKTDDSSTCAADNDVTEPNSKSEKENVVIGANAEKAISSQSVGNDGNNVNNDNKYRDETSADGNTMETDSSTRTEDGNVKEESVSGQSEEVNLKKDTNEKLHPADMEVETKNDTRMEGRGENNFNSNTTNGHTSNENNEEGSTLNGTEDKEFDNGGVRKKVDKNKKEKPEKMNSGPIAKKLKNKDKGETKDGQPARDMMDKAVSSENCEHSSGMRAHDNEGIKGNAGEKKPEETEEKETIVQRITTV